MNDIWAIVLAAGASRRMKTQKLLLPYNGKTIIETVLHNVTQTMETNVILVLGSHHNEIKNQIGHLPVKYCINNDYMDGMLSSVICGFRALPANSKAAIVFLGDQPQIPGFITGLLVKAWKESNKGIVIPTFNGKRGHPALIETKYIKEIEKLDPAKGLRDLYKIYEKDICQVECASPEILRDIDTPEEYSVEILKNS